jgi:hypothetical protein
MFFSHIFDSDHDAIYIVLELLSLPNNVWRLIVFAPYYNLTIEMKMETGRNFSMLEINSGHHNLPTYGMSLKSDNVEFVQYCGGHFENGDR